MQAIYYKLAYDLYKMRADLRKTFTLIPPGVASILECFNRPQRKYECFCGSVNTRILHHGAVICDDCGTTIQEYS